MQPSIFTVINHMNYINRHPHKFEIILMPMLICYMKLFVEIIIEYVSLALISSLKDSQQVIFCFLTIMFISEVDQLFYNHVRSDLKQRLEQKEYKIPIQNHSGIQSGVSKTKLNILDKILLYTADLCKLAYEVFYFHTFPYLVF